MQWSLRDEIAELLNGNVLWKPPENDRRFLTERMASRIVGLLERSVADEPAKINAVPEGADSDG